MRLEIRKRVMAFNARFKSLTRSGANTTVFAQKHKTHFFNLVDTECAASIILATLKQGFFGSFGRAS